MVMSEASAVHSCNQFCLSVMMTYLKRRPSSIVETFFCRYQNLFCLEIYKRSINVQLQTKVIDEMWFIPSACSLIEQSVASIGEWSRLFAQRREKVSVGVMFRKETWGGLNCQQHMVVTHVVQGQLLCFFFCFFLSEHKWTGGLKGARWREEGAPLVWCCFPSLWHF